MALAILLTAAAGQMTSALAQKANVFQTNSLWRYNLAVPYVCLDGTGWEQPGYDDSSWPEATGGFTGGETGAASLVGVTTRTLPAPTAVAGQRASFRKHFNIASPAGVSLIFSNRIDSSAAFWINGHDVFRLRAGNVGDPLPCTQLDPTDNEANHWDVFTLSSDALAGVLVAGDNVLAVSVGQNSATSSDMVFVCQLWSEIAFPVTITAQPVASQTATQCLSASFTVGVNGSSPITFQWIKDDVDIDPAINATATNQTLVVNNLTIGDAGNYKVRVTNPLVPAGVVSSPSMLTVVPDTTPPTVVRVIGEADLVTFTVTFSEAMDPASVVDEFAYEIRTTDTIPESLIISSPITITSPTTISIVTTGPRDPNKNYVLAVNEGGFATVSEACVAENIVAPTVVPIAVSIQVVGINDTQTWRYLDDGTDPGPTWADVNFNDSAWALGLAPFGDPVGEVLPIPIRTELTRGPQAGTADYTTAFFRIHFAMPGPTNGASMNIRTLVDDGLILYLNGVEIWRSNVLDTVTRTSYGAGAAGDIGSAYQGPFQLNVTNFVSGDNVLAGILYQADATSSDWVYAIEANVVVTSVFGGPVSFVNQPQSQNINEGQTAAFSVSVEGSQPITFQWQKSTGGAFSDIPGQTGSSLLIPNASPLDNGQYRVVANNDFGPLISSEATLTVAPNLVRPTLVSAAGSTNPSVINLSFSKPISAATAGTIGNYALTPVGGGAPLTIVSAVATGNDIAVTTAPRVFGTSYILTISGLRDTTATGNLIDPNPTIVNPLQQDFVVFTWNKTWRYETNCQDGVTWQATAFNDSAWQSGPGSFGLETSAAIVTLMANLGAQIQTPLPIGATQLAYYFRTTFDWPYSTVGVQFRLSHLVDDGGIFYVNGSAVASFNETNPPPLSCTNLSTGGGEASLQETNLAGIATGQNVLAVEVHQQTTGSSDVVFGAELVARVSSFGALGPRLSIVNEGANVRITWSPATGTLQFKNNLDDPNWTDVPGQVAGNTVVAHDQLKRFYSLRQ